MICHMAETTYVEGINTLGISIIHVEQTQWKINEFSF